MPSVHNRRIYAAALWSQRLRGHWPARPGRQRLLFGFCTSARTFATRFFQHTPHGISLCASLEFSATCILGGLAPPSLVSCWAHQKEKALQTKGPLLTNCKRTNYFRFAFFATFFATFFTAFLAFFAISFLPYFLILLNEFTSCVKKKQQFFYFLILFFNFIFPVLRNPLAGIRTCSIIPASRWRKPINYFFSGSRPTDCRNYNFFSVQSYRARYRRIVLL